MMKRNLLLGCVLLAASQLSYAGLVIGGGINNSGNGTVGVGVGENGSGSGSAGNGNGVVIVNGQQQTGAAAEQATNDIYASICASPFMKKYVSFCH
ncbi:hypothetical protein V6280_11710 [Serratia marcescens]|uniref:hypothetical protein n=1 Tax=Serratia marcescens TaxID=615 RepID=UPI003701542F